MTDSRHAVAFDRFLVPRGAMGAALLATTLLAATLRGIDAQCSSAACQAGHCVRRRGWLCGARGGCELRRCAVRGGRLLGTNWRSRAGQYLRTRLRLVRAADGIR